MKICDVTLREGEQRPGISYSLEQKVEAGLLLDQLGVDYIQPGFPIISDKDQKVIHRLSKVTEADIVGLCRALPEDIEVAALSNVDVVDIMVPISKWQRPYIVGTSEENLHEKVLDSVGLAEDYGLEIHIILMDAFRSPMETVIEFFDKYPTVKYITLADTVGAKTPISIVPYLENITNVVNPSRMGVHFHNDLGVATANSLAAISVGVEKIDLSIASAGERAGNASLEEVVVAALLDQDINSGVKVTKLIDTCNKITDILNEPINTNKPILGSSVYSHESGIHTAAMLKDPRTFEPFDPTIFGGKRQLLFGEYTGRSGARALLEEVGQNPTNEQINYLVKVLKKEGPVSLSDGIELASKVH